MKLIIDKLGRIEHAEMEIRKLTVLVGENNTNKTWAAYCLYGLARHLSWTWSSLVGDDFGHARLPIEPQTVHTKIEKAVHAQIKQLRLDETATLFSLRREQLLTGIRGSPSFSLSANHIADLLRLPPDELSPDCSASLQIKQQEFTSPSLAIQVKVNPQQRSVRLTLTQSEPTLEPLDYRWRAEPGAPISAISEHLTQTFMSFAHRFLGPATIFPLPSERKALVSTYKLLRSEFYEVLSQPVVEFANILAVTENLSKANAPSSFPKAIEYLEGNILDGSVEYQSAGAGQMMKYIPSGSQGVSLRMHGASSMVRSLSGLDLYLRYWAESGSFLIIDELEMNAHPEAQVRLTELIAYLVNQGIRVVLTTHSPYVVDHLNNLLRAKKLSEKDQLEVEPEFMLENRECFLEPKDVAAYVFEEDDERKHVTVRSIFDAEDEERQQIEWETFGKTSGYVHDLNSAELLPRLYRTEEQ